MEVLVPAIGLGFLWIISNQKKNSEGYHNLNKNLKLGGDQIIPQNFPVDDTKLNNVLKINLSNKILKCMKVMVIPLPNFTLKNFKTKIWLSNTKTQSLLVLLVKP